MPGRVTTPNVVHTPPALLDAYPLREADQPHREADQPHRPSEARGEHAQRNAQRNAQGQWATHAPMRPQTQTRKRKRAECIPSRRP